MGQCLYDSGEDTVKRSVRVRLRGGLGNQLFGWATGFALAERLGLGLEMLADRIPRSDHDILDPRHYELGYFGIDPSRVRRPVRLKRPNIKLLEPLAQRLSGPSALFREEGFHYDSRFLSLAGPVTLEGYFQSWRYFSSVEAKVSSFLIDNAHYTPAAEAAISSLAAEPWVGIHIRRGDYMRVGTMATLMPSYYSAAVRLARDKTDAKRSVVFSDDIVAASAIFPRADCYIGTASMSVPGDVLMTLASATALVGANSTLSWWAAFLKAPNSGPIIFPVQWFSNREIDTADLLPPTWLRMPL